MLGKDCVPSQGRGTATASGETEHRGTRKERIAEGAEAQQNERLEKKKVAKVGWNNNGLELLEGLRSQWTTSKSEEAPGWMDEVSKAANGGRAETVR